MLMDQKALRKRINAVYSRMQQRARPRYWKRGRNAGKLRVPGLEVLSFTADDLWAKAVEMIGPSGVTQCYYCRAIGRPAFPIDLANIVFDHYEPLSRGGSWDLDNIRGCCEVCNREKGEFSFGFFVAISQLAEKADPKDRTYLGACLRTHGIAHQGFRDKRKAAEEPSVPVTGSLALQEDF
jgi:hypothetical protein